MEILEFIERDFEKQKKELEKQKEELLKSKRIQILFKYSKRKPENEEEFKELCSNVLCWKNLAYCCAYEKNCFWNHNVLEILGISKEEYIKKKENFGREFYLSLIWKNNKK